jgi:hypothetical protein
MYIYIYIHTYIYIYIQRGGRVGGAVWPVRGTTTYVSSYCLVYMSAYYYTCVLILLCICVRRFLVAPWQDNDIYIYIC